MLQLQFPDKTVTYETFVKDVALQLSTLLQQAKEKKEVISQREAYRVYGEANVRRWLRLGLLTVRKRPGKVEYLSSELSNCQSRQQDYF